MQARSPELHRIKLNSFFLRCGKVGGGGGLFGVSERGCVM